MIEFNPKNPFTNNFNVTGETFKAEIFYDMMTESGRMIFQDTGYHIEKGGPFSGYWTLARNGEPVVSTQKTSTFIREFDIYSDDYLLSLTAPSPFTRDMRLQGEGFDATIKPDHPLTRRGTIKGDWADPLIVCFALWISGLMWKRSQGT